MCTKTENLPTCHNNCVMTPGDPISISTIAFYLVTINILLLIKLTLYGILHALFICCESNDCVSHLLSPYFIFIRAFIIQIGLCKRVFIFYFNEINTLNKSLFPNIVINMT